MTAPDAVLPRAHACLTRWRELVCEVEEGYGWSGPELANDLFCRTQLAAVWRLLPEKVRTARQAELEALDERFRAATIPFPGHEQLTGQWWTWRVPRVLEVEPGLPRHRGWPMGWEMMPFPKPDQVDVVE
ncbi:hypothetical protein [Streptomyces aurantiogriseus]|uniref:hypothetical protein n=1 Tax=Streptomyces aurantiogriseus TaxID=66870 RepID=UPI00167898C4|nr:hypothetical protein [Streptomyces aurantiogriseus]